jgi:hypothetical protein
MATKAKATRSIKKATKPVRKAAAKKVVKKPVPAKATKAAPKAKKPAVKKAPASRKVTARKPTGKMVRPATKAARPAPKRAAERPATPRPATAARKAVPAAKAAPKAAAKAPKAAPKAARRSPRVEERRALPHKAPSHPSFQMNDYFDGSNASPYPTLPPSRREILPVAVEWKEKMRPGELYQAFKRFFEANELGNRFIGPLREGAGAIVEFEGDPQSYKVVKVRGRAAMELGRPASAEVYIKLSRHAVEAMLAPNATKPNEYVARFVSLMAEPDPAKRIEVKLLCTHGEAIRKGYLGVVAAGGKQLAEALLQLGHSLPAEFVKHLH